MSCVASGQYAGPSCFITITDLLPLIKISSDKKEKLHQALVFFVTSSCSNKLEEHIYFVDIIQLKELCTVLKEFTAAFVWVWQNIIFLGKNYNIKKTANYPHFVDKRFNLPPLIHVGRS